MLLWRNPAQRSDKRIDDRSAQTVTERARAPCADDDDYYYYYR